MMQLYQIRSQGHLQNMLKEFELDMEAMIRQLMDLLLNGIQKKH